MFNFSLALFYLFSMQAYAGTFLNTQCTKTNSAPQIEGFNINKPYTIASVTKIFTSHWAISRLGPKFRYPTKIHITPTGDNAFDVHLEGALFPYFDKSMYQFLVGELNRIGVRKINNLTFDENFLYANNIRTNPPLAHGNADLDTIEIMKALRADTKTLNVELAALNARAMTIENMNLPNSLVLSINDISFSGKADFHSAENTASFYLYSSELYRNLKEMNRNSNNFVADKIFSLLSQKENYFDFVLRHLLSVKPDEVTLYNGSGYPEVVNNQKFYNVASCAAVIEMMTALRQTMLNTGLDIKDILPVAGKDSVDDGDSTVTKIYGNAQTSGSLIGKTGSVNNTIALAGIVITENENIFFQTSYQVDNTPEDRGLAYLKIKDWLTNQLIRNKKKTDLDSYIPKSYLAFDKNSQLIRTESANLLK